MHNVLAHSAAIPAIGLGTWELRGDLCTRIVAHALEVGYRHVDTAQMYGNERDVGRALAGSSVPREQIWLTTKVWPDRFEETDLYRSVEESVEKLGTEPDLLLLHWPNPKVPLAGTMRALNRAKRDGMTRHIGISNFNTRLIEQAWSLTEEPLIANQVEYHPYLDQTVVREAVRARDMALIAYCPVAQGKVFHDPRLRQICERHGKTGGQVALRWLVQQDGVAAIPRSSRPENVTANLEIFDFELSSDELGEIERLGSRSGRLVSPAGFAPDWD